MFHPHIIHRDSDIGKGQVYSKEEKASEYL